MPLFDDAAVIAEASLAKVSPFTCSLASFAYFKHARSCTVWLHPTDPAESAESADPADDDDEEEDAAPEDAAPKAVISNDDTARTTTTPTRAPGAPSSPRASPGLMAGRSTHTASFTYAARVNSTVPLHRQQRPT